MTPISDATISELLTEVVIGRTPIISAWRIFAYLFINGGWIIVAIAVLHGLFYFWVFYHRHKFAHRREWVMLAIDVPKDNLQSPKAVENIFAHLAGAHGSLTLAEQYWSGMTQDYFSLEIVSLEGYVQFIIRCVKRWRDLVESAIYAQYPEAEITEIDDYTKGFPAAFPNDRYFLYGTEFIPVESEAYPIRSYQEFEHPLTQEFKDPVLALMETMGKLGQGEQLWLQIIIVPIDQHWREHALHVLKKLIGDHRHETKGIIRTVFGEAGKIGSSIVDELVRGPSTGHEANGKVNQPPTMMLHLSPYEKERAEGITRKIKKIGFETKIRSVYIATKDHYNAFHGREALVGSIKQVNTNDLNALKPDTKRFGVHAHYFFKEWRKNWKRSQILRWYRGREWDYGNKPFVLNIEELATLWHFPTKTETMPMRHMVQRTEFKHTPPPSSVPFAAPSSPSEAARAESKTAAPHNIPFA